MRPDRYRNAVVPHIYLDGAAEAVEFYKRAFDAEELFRIAQPDGKVTHSELSVCGATIMLSDPTELLYGEPRRLGGCTAGLHLFVDDNATVLQRAVEMGCEEIQAPTEMFYGGNSASVRDPFGHVWVILTWKEDLDAREMNAAPVPFRGFRTGFRKILKQVVTSADEVFSLSASSCDRCRYLGAARADRLARARAS